MSYNRRQFVKMAAMLPPAVATALEKSTGTPAAARLEASSHPTATTAFGKGTVTVKCNRTAQEIDGFGASAAFHMAENLMDFPEPQRSQVLDVLFSQTRGAGLSMVRNFIGDGGSWGSKQNGPSPSIEPQEGVWNWKGDEDEIWFMREAGKRGCTRYMSTAWSPPAWMKTNNNVIGGRLRPDKYQAFAEYLSMYVRGYKEQHGIDIYAVSPANEPDVTVKYSSCYWNGREFHEFVKALIPIFKRDKVTARLILGEDSGWTENPVLQSFEDPATKGRIDIVGAHAYMNHLPVAPWPFPPVTQRSGLFIATLQAKKKIWQTEVANLGKNHPGINDGLYWAKLLHTHVAENHSSAWFYWWDVSPYPAGGSLIHLDMDKPTYAVDKRLYTIGNYSRFVRPGYFRVEVEPEPSPGGRGSAYKSEAERKLVMVAINENDSARDLELRLSGVTASSALPCRTSENEDLATLPEIRISNNMLKASLAQASVTTFVASVTPSKSAMTAPRG